MAGVAPTLKSSIDVTKASGTVVIVSIFGHPIEWNPMQLTNTGVNLLLQLHTHLLHSNKQLT